MKEDWIAAGIDQTGIYQKIKYEIRPNLLRLIIGLVTPDTGSVSVKGENMTSSKHNQEGNSSETGEPDPGPYWHRMHRDWRFWVGAFLMGAALAVYLLTEDLSFIPGVHTHHSMPAESAQ